MSSARTIVHVCRHGQVHNPGGLLYGRLPGFNLSDLGRQMAERLGEYFADVDVNHLRCSPLDRAQQTMAPIAARHPELDVVTDDRVIEAANKFEGSVFGSSTMKSLLTPQGIWNLRNPLQPSWGEPYKKIAARMRAAIRDAADAAGEGGQAVIVAHQLPIWIARLDAQGRFLPHDPRKRECTLASVTSFAFTECRLVDVTYAEPAKDLLPAASHGATTYQAGT